MPDDHSSHISLAPAPRQMSRPVRRRSRRLALLLGLLLLVPLLGIPLPAAPPVAPTTTIATPPLTVRAAAAVRGDIPIMLQGLGVVTPFATVVVRTQIAGQLQSVGFREGQTLHQGDFLAQIDPRPYEAALAAARGQQAQDQALLDEARSDLARYRTLLQRDDISRQKAEDQGFLVRQYEGAVATDQARIDAAQINLSYCRILAPISGRAGLRLVDPGNFVQAGDPAGLVVLAQIQPISVVFPLPQDELPRVMRRLEAGASLPVGAYDRRNARLFETGVLESIDNMVDTATGTAKLRARFTNPANALFPNQFVNVRLEVDTLRDAVTVPEAAIQEGADGHYVWLVAANKRVRLRHVATGPAAGGRIAVTEGLEPGAVVVIDGADRLREGAKVAATRAPPESGADAGANARADLGQAVGAATP